ncbi:Bromodomain-containing protein [Rickenella mellea]|uniref:Bromodomain-containing protein n=1 Tax=Rickenella mellea TaxID=50990 RepID=A0A4Y7Q0R5_9AGAM|nr:Bromodomain-containing protein [Rickenella mellea]
MLKRELGVAASDVVLDGPRAKRSRNVSGESGGSGVSAVKDKDGDGDVEMKDDVVVGGGGDDNGGSGMTKEDVREKGVEVWQIVKGAVNKENRTLSTDFLRLPSKRQYPDYYTLIKRPIALEDIHANLDKLKYPTLEALRADFEVCFKNAKKYNVRESQIWRDAKTLQKIATKEIDKILHPNEDEHVDVDGSDDDGDGTSKKKKKLPNMTRLMKSRLQKLVGRKDDDGRQLSNVFMDLPSKKKWPLYYKTIKRPICIEDIFKRIKRKEYETVADFMAEVELVFANALQFNDDHSPIWEDAVLLRVRTFLPFSSHSSHPHLISNFYQSHRTTSAN